MNIDDQQETPSSEQTASATKRTLPDADETKSFSKRMKTLDSTGNVDGYCPEDEVGKLTLEKMVGILSCEGHLSRGPPPKRREVVGILLPPVESKKKAILIKGSISIGKSPNCDIVLTKYGTCSNISDHHATITYDRTTGMFELLNYSTTYTVVDNLGYSNGVYPNVAPAPISKLNEFIAKRGKATSAEMEEMLDEFENANDTCLARHGKVYRPCDQERYLKQCFHGCATVNHGSVLRFGCIEFIFCSLHQL